MCARYYNSSHSSFLFLTLFLSFPHTLPFFSSHSSFLFLTLFRSFPHALPFFSSQSSFLLQDGKTALFVSACNGHDEVVTLLLHNRVETNTADTVYLYYHHCSISVVIKRYFMCINDDILNLSVSYTLM